jgi:hypothetical protein
MQGQEEQALAYFKSLLETASSKEEREDLKEIIAKLEREIKEKQPKKPRNTASVVQNLPGNCVPA